ncbi:hypothetical protein BS329_38525 [Amycolatopsis coloradensis]|uniref:Uncharacterized protein n=1 Tax=Amycolatopsis coloradensis TaxID=76021 RepID=A0A1R0KF25_9PSEU|nr:hypothetical protein [Amycolatopsis coloradensis]OLZ43746.1 hypothetical protein BS329_38525 [Amycolatopsis coloradensis]
MREFARVLAVAAAAAGLLALPGTASAAPPPGCWTDTNGSTWASGTCPTGSYKVVVEYCRPNCHREEGYPASNGRPSGISFSPGGSIAGVTVEYV